MQQLTIELQRDLFYIFFHLLQMYIYLIFIDYQVSNCSYVGVPNQCTLYASGFDTLTKFLSYLIYFPISNLETRQREISIHFSFSAWGKKSVFGATKNFAMIQFLMITLTLKNTTGKLKNSDRSNSLSVALHQKNGSFFVS